MKYRNPETGQIWDSETGQIIDPQPEAFTEELQSPEMRGLGLGTRSVATGAASLPLMAGDAANSLLNMIPGVDLQMPSALFQEGMTNMGLPTPETSQEQLLGAIQSGAASGASVPAAASKFTGKVADILMKAPGTQMVSGGTASGASELAAQSGAGPVGQFAAGMLGGAAGVPMAIAPSALSNAALTAVRAPKPFYVGGREDIAGQVLRQQASDPNVQIPDNTGLHTTGQATRDMGLMSLEKTTRGMDDVGFANIEIAQNARNRGLLEGMAGTPDDVVRMETARETMTAPMRESAIRSQSAPVNTKNIETVINNILKTEAGERDIVASALKNVRAKLRTPGKDGKKGDFKTDMSRLYGIRKHINDKIAGKGETPADRYAKRELITVRDALDDELDAVSSGWRDYLNTYSSLSTDIDRIKTLQNIQAKTETAVPDVTGAGTTQVISRPKWKSQVTSRMNDLDLTPDQKSVLTEITKDLDVTASPRALRQAGSDTFRNISSANLLGNMMSPEVAASPAAQKLVAPLRWLYSESDKVITDLIVEAMQDPATAKRLMARPSVKNMREISYHLKDKMAGSAIGTSSGLLGE